MNKNAFNRKTTGRQRGFTLVELLIVLAIIAVIAIFGVPFARGIIIGGKTEPTASDISKVVTRMRSNFSGQGTTPYNNLGAGAAATANFANTARGLTSALTVAGAGAAATVQHDIGATNSQIAVAIGTITVAGDSFTVTVPTVNEAACPGLAAQLSKAAEVITINGVNVKAAGANYNGGTAQNACTAGDTNAFVFTFR
jgi:prepilin-type N-terminal cleavage/methylation domain-containing protein